MSKYTTDKELAIRSFVSDLFESQKVENSKAMLVIFDFSNEFINKMEKEEKQ